jgi:hypothetical protein
VRHHAEGLLQLRHASVHNAGPNDGMLLDFDRQSFQEGVALARMDRRGGLHDGVIFVVGQTERHVSSLEAAAPR